MDTSSENNTQKKDPFENLSREELIKKCKNLLAIAQKAKQVKDDVTEENKSLANALKKLEGKSRNDVQTMQEMLDALTQQKLQLVTEKDTLKNQVNSIENKFKDVQNELILEKSKYSNLEMENEGLNRQIKRLTDENDQLITHLDVLEKQINELNNIGEQQRIELLALETRALSNDKQLSNNEVSTYKF